MDETANMDLSIGVLSWRSHETLRKTLNSYRQGRLTDCARESVVFFNEISGADRLFLACFNADGWRCAGNESNLGIFGGTDALARLLGGKYLLMLQNDCPLVADVEATRRYLESAVALLDSGAADVVRCRSRTFPGQGFADKKKYDRYYGDGWAAALRRLCRPWKARRMIGRAPYAVPDADRRFPNYITCAGSFLLVDSEVINFTDQPFLISRNLLLELLEWGKAHPRGRQPVGRQALEVCLNTGWWRQQHFKVAVGEGIFTHDRVGGGFRKTSCT